MAEREASVIVKAKNQASQTFAQVFNDANAQLGRTTQAQNEASNAAKKHGLSIVDLAAKLYLVQVGLRNVINAVKEAYEFGKLGATVEQMGTSFERVVISAGGTVELLNQLRVASKGTISDFDLMAATNQALVGTQGDVREEMLAAIPQLLEMARASSILNPQLGDTNQQFDRLTLGLKRLEPRIIDDIGLELRLSEVNRDYAKQIGTTVDALTTEERTMALLNAVLERHADYVALAGGAAESAVDPYMRFEATLKNIRDAAAKRINVVIGVEVIEKGQPVLDTIKLLFEWEDKLVEHLRTHADDVVQSTLPYNEYANEVTRAAYAAGFLINENGDLTTVLGRVVRENYLLTESERTAIRVGDERMENIRALRDIHTNVTDQIGKNTEEQIKFEQKRNQMIYDSFLKELQIRERAMEKTTDINQRIEDEQQKSADRIEDIMRDSARKRIDLVADEMQSRLDITNDYNDRITDINKDISELVAELSGDNPYLSEATEQEMAALEAALAVGNLSVEQEEELQRQLANVKERAREEERVNRINARIRELEERKAQLEQEKQQELKDLAERTQAKIREIELSEQEQTRVVMMESDKRVQALKADLAEIAEETTRQLKENTIDALLSIIPAGDRAAEGLQAMKLRMHGATEDMITDMYRLRVGIDSPVGLTGAIDQFTNRSFASFFTASFAVSGLNNQLWVTNFLLNQAADAAVRLDSSMGGGGGGAGRRQHGGFVHAGETAIVGEDGPELFTSSTNGRVTPNRLSNFGGGGGGGNTVNITVQAMAFQGSQADAAKFGNWVAPIVLQYMDKFGGNVNAVGSRRIR